MNLMMMAAGRWRELLREAEGAGSGGGAGAGESEGAGEGGAGAGGGESEGAGGGDQNADARPWHQREGALDGPTRDWLRARGMLSDDPEDVLLRAIKGHMSAEKALGKGADTLIEKPGEGQSVEEWLRAQGAALGVPDAPDGYEIEKPELPEGMSWDEGLEAKFRDIAHETGMTGAQAQKAVGLFAEHMGGMFKAAGEDLAAATQEMRQALERDWGQGYGVKVEQAQRAAAALGEKAGLDTDQMLAVGQLLKPKVGDAGIMRLFAAVGEMLGDDQLVPGQGAPGLTTPADAKAELDRFTGQDGEYGRAFAARDTKRLRELEPKRQSLLKIAGARRS